MRSLSFNIATSIAAVFFHSGAWACAVCGVDDTAYYVSYLFMLAMPLTVMGVIGGVFIYSSRQNKKNSLNA